MFMELSTDIHFDARYEMPGGQSGAYLRPPGAVTMQSPI